MIRRATAYALDYFERHPDRVMVSLAPPDGGHYCRCQRCLDHANVVETWDFTANTLMGRTAEGEVVSVTSEAVFHFTNEVARAVREKHPDKWVGTLAYTTYAHPPTFDLEPNVHVGVTAGYRFTPMAWEDQLEAFSQRARSLSVYYYYDVLQWSWERPGRSMAAQLDRLQERLRKAHAMNVRGATGEMSNNFGPYGIGYYAIARILWDAQTEVREVEERLIRDAFGPAAPPVKQVYHRWSAERWDWEQADPIEMLLDTTRDLQEAARLTAGMDGYRDRVDRLRMYAHYLNHYMPFRVGRDQQDVELWIERYGEQEAKDRFDRLVNWHMRLQDTHMVHTRAFLSHVTRRGNLLGLDTSDWTWRAQRSIPSAEEVDELLAADLDLLRERALSTVEVEGDAADVQNQEGENLRVGQILTGRLGNAVYVFELPVLPEGRAVVEADLTARVTVAYGSEPEAGPIGVDLWGIGFRDTTEPILRYAHGGEGADADDVLIQRDWFNARTTRSGAWVRTGPETRQTLGVYLQRFYDSNPDYNGGSYVFLRLSPDRNPQRPAAAEGPPQTGFAMRSARSSSPPRLILTTAEVE